MAMGLILTVLTKLYNMFITYSRSLLIMLGKNEKNNDNNVT